MNIVDVNFWSGFAETNVHMKAVWSLENSGQLQIDKVDCLSNIVLVAKAEWCVWLRKKTEA